MVKYQQLNIAMNGNSSGFQSSRESGSSAESPGGVESVNVRPGANFI